MVLSLVPSGQLADQTIDDASSQNLGNAVLSSVTLDQVKSVEEKCGSVKKKLPGFPNPISSEIYLQQILHENVFVRAKDRHLYSGRTQVSGQPSGEGSGLLGHFCMTLSHRIFSNKVLAELENLASMVAYLHLLTHPTWHSRTSSWSLTMKVPQSILHQQNRPSDICSIKNKVRSQFQTKVVVNDNCISVEGEGAPNVVGMFKEISEDNCSTNSYDCDLADLPVILLQQVASQVIGWLQEEAVTVGMKASRDFLSLSLELDQGETLGLVAHIDPGGTQGCISWWLVMEDGKLHHGGSENRRFLGHLSLEALYSTLMDFMRLWNSSGSL